MFDENKKLFFNIFSEFSNNQISCSCSQQRKFFLLTKLVLERVSEYSKPSVQLHSVCCGFSNDKHQKRHHGRLISQKKVISKYIIIYIQNNQNSGKRRNEKNATRNFLKFIFFVCRSTAVRERS